MRAKPHPRRVFMQQRRVLIPAGGFAIRRLRALPGEHPQAHAARTGLRDLGERPPYIGRLRDLDLTAVHTMRALVVHAPLVSPGVGPLIAPYGEARRV